MARAVLDASALLATIQQEPGRDRVNAVIREALVCAVNQAEAVSKLVEKGMAATLAVQLVENLECASVSADTDLGLLAGAMHAKTKGGNISLGDRFCLALAQREGLPALTADRAWSVLDVGVEVVLIR